jgi:hypothetical protein
MDMKHIISCVQAQLPDMKDSSSNKEKNQNATSSIPEHGSPEIKIVCLLATEVLCQQKINYIKSFSNTETAPVSFLLQSP